MPYEEIMQASLAETQARLKNMSVFKALIREIVVDDAAKSFATQTAPDGQPWPPRKKDYPWPMLVKSGNLSSSVANGEVDDSLTFTANCSYGGYHNFGTASIPERAFLKMTPALADKIADKVFNYILTGEV